MNVACISERTFYRHTSSYVNSVIIQQWRAHQQNLLERLSESERGLVLAGDGRCDSAGYCAKFGSFTFIEEDINRVVDFQLVQVSTVHLFRNGTNSFSPSFGNPAATFFNQCNKFLPHGRKRFRFYGSVYHDTIILFVCRAMRSEIVPGWNMKGWCERLHSSTMLG